MDAWYSENIDTEEADKGVLGKIRPACVPAQCSLADIQAIQADNQREGMLAGTPIGMPAGS